MIKDRIIRWAIKQVVKEEHGTYAGMKYLEDVLENEMGEKMFVFSHRLVPINKDRLAKFNNNRTSGAVAFSDNSIKVESDSPSNGEKENG